MQWAILIPLFIVFIAYLVFEIRTLQQKTLTMGSLTNWLTRGIV
jgi:hypothetical protein